MVAKVSAGVGAVAALLAVGCVRSESLTCGEDTVRVGVLLPFTGDQAATGANVHRALIWTAEQINASLPPGSPQFCLVAADTASDPAIGAAAGRSLMENQHVIAIIGPEEAEVALALLPQLAASETPALSGSMALAEGEAYAMSRGFFFRLAPTNRSLSAVLASRMEADKVKKGAVAVAGGAFNGDFGESMQARLRELGSPATPTEVIESQPDKLPGTLARLTAGSPDGIVLSAPVRLAAQFVESLRLSSSTRLYLAPTLKQDTFLANLRQNAINGSAGVCPAVSNDGSLFDKAFADRFNGDVPFLASYYYYDALAVYALAYEAAARAAGNGRPTRRAIRDKILDVSSSSLGQRTAWYELDQGLKEVLAGELVNYRGVSGGVDFNERGEVGESLVRTFTIVNNRFVDDAVVVAKTP